MKTKLFICFVIYSVVCVTSVFAQKGKRSASYNYTRGVEAVNQENYEEALRYLTNEIEENPKNGYAYSWIATIYHHDEKLGLALTAISNALKYLPRKDAGFIAATYAIRADLFLELKDTVSALNDFSSAIKANPEDEDYYDKRAQIYFEQEKYDLASADYRKMIELKPGSVMGYMGLGRNAKDQKKWEEAIRYFDYVTKLASDYSSGYAFRAESYIALGKWNEATDDLISAMRCEWDKKALYHMLELKEPALTMILSKLKIQAAKSPNVNVWPYLAGVMYEQNQNYRKAIELYSEANKKDATPAIYKKISDCYFELGVYDEALSNINQALNMDSTDLSYMVSRARIYYESGDSKAAIGEWDKVLASFPEYADGYYHRGWMKELDGDLDGAVEDFSMAIVIEPENTYAYVNRAQVYKKQGKADFAESDFKKVIDLEGLPEKYSCIHYAYQGLGQYDKAIEAIDSIIATDEDKAGNYYDAACLYSRMNDKDKALEYLEKSLEEGYSKFNHIRRDYDMDLIRDTDKFKSLLEKYEKTHNTKYKVGETKETYGENVTTEIPFTKEGGVCKVKCKVNGLPLHFIFDTGASDVTISMVEASFMMKNGYLSGNDVMGSQRYKDANGDVSVGTVINLKNVNFGGLDLNNVRASVVRNQKAPLLLGQSVLGRLGKIEIDNSRHIMKITHKK